MNISSSLKVAFVYDRVNTPHGGAERVLLALHKLFPKAPLYTSVYDAEKAKWAKVFDVRTSFLQQIPFSKQKHRELLPLMPMVFENLDLSEFDLVISITSAEAKAIKVGPQTLHVCYILTPPRYLWSHTLEYQTGILSPMKALIFSLLRRWDYRVAQKVSYFIPISKLVQQRVEKYYRKKTLPVIYPPFQFETKQIVRQKEFQGNENYLLIVSRLVAYKKVDLVIRAAIEMKKKLVVIGDGPETPAIRQLITSLDPQSKYIYWLKNVTDKELIQAYSAAKTFILPTEEDFGITALESQSCGTPVVVYEKSGAAETVKHNVTGIHIPTSTISAIKQGVTEIEKRQWDSDSIKSHADQYNEENFIHQFDRAIQHMKGQV